MNKIKNIRLQKNLSTYELADMSDISQSYVSELEKFKRKPTLEVARRIARALDSTLDDVFPTTEITEHSA